VLNVKLVSGSVGVDDVVAEYDVAFGDERVADSIDDRPVLELSNRDKVLLHQALVEHAPEVLDCWDTSHTHRAIANGVRFDDSVPLINHDNVNVQRVLGWFQGRALPPTPGSVVPARWVVPAGPTNVEVREGDNLSDWRGRAVAPALELLGHYRLH
jgi:hypothetical protein